MDLSDCVWLVTQIILLSWLIARREYTFYIILFFNPYILFILHVFTVRNNFPLLTKH